MSGKTFFIADTHFWHNNILKYENRPFENVEEMNKYIIKRWNETVNKNDTVWFLGDWHFSNKEEFKKIICKLKGNIKMVMGNHDNWNEKFYYECGIKFVSYLPVILNDFFILSHKPLYSLKSTPFFNIFGHVHGSPLYTTKGSNHQCVSIERCNDWAPIEIKEYNDYLNNGTGDQEANSNGYIEDEDNEND